MNFRGELSGAFAFGGKDVQKKLLEADGIEVVNGTVDLKNMDWRKEMINCEKTDTDDYLFTLLSFGCCF